MKPYLLGVVGAILLGLVSAASADLKSDIEKVLRDKALTGAKVGIQVARLGATADEDRIVFSHNAATPLTPASNMKLVTTAAALETLGPDFRFRTLLVRRGEDLILVGDGDPTFGDLELLKRVNWGVTTVFEKWAGELKRLGRNSVGNVLVDDSVFDEVFLHPRWPADQQASRYVAQVGGMNLNFNCVDVVVRGRTAGSAAGFSLVPPTRYVKVSNSCTSGGQNAVWLNRAAGGNSITLRGSCPVNQTVQTSVTIHDPPMFAATVLAETLAGAEIKVTGKVGRDRTVRALVTGRKPAEAYAVIAAHETPIAQVLARANKESRNLYAEALCKRVGYAASGESGSWASGTAAAAAVLRRAGAEPEQFKLDDGCGLSRENAVSASALVSLLRHAHRAAWREVYVNSLAIGGVDGTLDDRFTGDLKGRVLAKSGYINAVSTLSGYLKTKDGTWYAFSILINNPRGSGKPIHEAIVKAIDQNKP